MQKINTPICIIGAGPAGITTSLFLSKHKIHHVLVEAGSLPQDKVCGESFIGRVLHVLKEIDPKWENELYQERIIAKSHQVKGFWQQGAKQLSWDFSPKSTPFLKAKRSIFDSTLLKKAQESPYLTYYDRCQISTYNSMQDGVELVDKHSTIQINAQLVILSVGEQINQLNKLFTDYPSDGVPCLASRIYYSNPVYQDDSYASEIHFFNKPASHILYTTRLPDDSAMIEIFMVKSDAKKINFKLEDCLLNSIHQSQILSKRFSNADRIGKAHGKSILLGSYPRKLSDNRFLIAGSAMGSVHVFTGFGVGHAMRSGQLAAYWAFQSLTQKDYSAAYLSQYDKAIQSRFKFDFFIGKVLLLCVKYPKLFFLFSYSIFFIRMMFLRIILRFTPN